MERPVGSRPRRTRPAHFELAPARGASDPRCAAWIERVEELAVRIARAGGLDEDGARFLGVALREAVTNALRHGSRGDERDRVSVAFRLVEDRTLVVTVRDRGPGFDPATVPDPSLPENLGRSGGRGIFYMRRFTDEVSFFFPARGGTVARLLKGLPGGG